MTVFKPEGWRIHSDENRHACRSLPALQEAAEKGLILEARASLCTTDHDLIVDLGFCKGIIPRLEGAIGIDDGSDLFSGLFDGLTGTLAKTVKGRRIAVTLTEEGQHFIDNTGVDLCCCSVVGIDKFIVHCRSLLLCLFYPIQIYTF